MPINLQMNFTNTRKNVYTSTVKTATKLPVIEPNLFLDKEHHLLIQKVRLV